MTIKYIRTSSHAINIAYFTALLIGGLILALHYEITHGAHLDTPYGVAPRLLANCESKWVGYDYGITLEPVCRHVWLQITRETILDYPIQ